MSADMYRFLNRYATNPRVSRGFSLVELMVAMAIGLILISGVVTVFAGNKRNADLNAAMANIQESARFAINTIAADIRLAGYQGCIDINRQSVVSQTANAPVIGERLSQTATTGSLIQADGSWAPLSPVGFSPPDDNDAVPGTHALMLQFGHAAQQSGLTGPMSIGGNPNLSGPVPLDRAIPGLAVGDFAIVSNCEAGDLFQVTGLGAGGVQLAHAAGGNRSGNLQQVYGNERTVGQTTAMKFESNIYYIGETGLTNEDGSNVTALFQQGLPYTDDNPPTELIQGVENLRVSFGLRDNQGNLRYVSPDAANFVPQDVEAIQIGLLISSWESVADSDDANTYMLAGQSIAPEGSTTTATASATHPGDKRFRLAFNTTIKVRNRRNLN